MTAADESGTNPITILLVEPNAGDSRLFAESLGDAKFTNTVHTVADGEVALDYLHQRNEYADVPRPDLVLLEPRLPKTDGQELVAELAAEPVLCDIPVVVLTSSDMGEVILRSHGLEADHYVQKPIEPADVLDFAQEIERFWLALVEKPAEE